MRITSKKQFYDRARRGLCGNTPRTWTVEEFSQNLLDRPDWVCMRSQAGINHLCFPEVDRFRVFYLAVSYPMENWLVSEIPPEKAARGKGLQGELSHLNGQWYLYYTHDMGYMRQRLKESGQHATGWQVTRLLKGHLSPSDYDMLMDLFDLYTEGDDYPVIEFANFRVPWGLLNRNLVVWEIRNGY